MTNPQVPLADIQIGDRVDLGYPTPGRITKTQRITRDGVELIRIVALVRGVLPIIVESDYHPTIPRLEDTK